MSMSPAALLECLEVRGAVLRTNGSDIRVKAPKGVVTREMREMIRVNKLALVALLSRPEPPVSEWSRRAAMILSGIEDADLRGQLRGEFEGKAATGEYEDGLCREDAERQAYRALISAVKEA